MKHNRLMTLTAAVACLACVARADLWQDLASYEWGGESKAPEQLMKLVGETPAEQLGVVEQKLIAVLGAKEATDAGKQHACRMLQRIGTDACVPALAELLADADLAHSARLPLQMMASEAAGAALRDALGKAPDGAKPGIIGSIAERGDAKAVKALGGLVNAKGAAVARAAALALGKIGGEDAARPLYACLTATRQRSSLAAARMEGALLCADGLAAGKPSAAAELYTLVYELESEVHQVAALRGLIRTDAAKAAKLVTGLLKADDSLLRRGAMRLVVMEKSVDLTKAVAACLSGLSPAQQAEVVGALGERGDRAALGAVTGLLKSGDQAVREAAIAAVGGLGDAGSVQALLEQVADDAVKDKALAALAGMTAPDVDVALIKCLEGGALKAGAITALARRGTAAAAPVLLGLTVDKDAGVRQAAWEALPALASADHMDIMMQAILATKDKGERGRAEGAIKKFCGTVSDRARCFEVAAERYGQAEESTKLLILDLGAIAGGGKALELTKGALASGNKTLRDRAIRALSSWSDVSATPALLELARSSADAKEQILALRGYIRGIGVDSRRPSHKDKLKMYGEAWGLAKRADEKRQIVSGLRNIKHPDALKALAAHLDDADVKAEASMAALDLGWDLRKRNRDDVAAIAKQILDTSTDKRILSKAKRNYNETKPKK
jgi:HEAT repeat protein